MDSTSLADALPPPAALVAVADDRWSLWVEKGRAHDRRMRERWFELGCVVLVGVLLTAALVLGLQ